MNAPSLRCSLVVLALFSALALHAQVYYFTTVAGDISAGAADGTNATARFSGPMAVAADSAGRLFVADTGNHTIRRLTPAGTNWVVETLAGLAGTIGSADGTNSSARFNQPAGTAFDNDGSVLVADTGNHTIRRLRQV